MEWMCETEKCLVDEELLDNLLQSQNYLSWTPMNYSQFWGRTLDEGRNGKLGTEAPMVRICDFGDFCDFYNLTIFVIFAMTTSFSSFFVI